MVVVLIAWIALALALGALIGRAIRRADDAQFPDRVEQAWWVVPPPAADGEDDGVRAAPRDSGVLAA